MSGLQSLKQFVQQRITAAVEEIMGHVERTITEYEEEMNRYKKLLEEVLQPKVKLQRADVLQLLVVKEEVPPEEQECSPSLDQEDPEPPHIKEEQEGEQLQGLEEADITKFTFTPVPVKSEDDEEKPQSSQLHQRQTEENRETNPPANSSTEQMETEADEEACGGLEPPNNTDPGSDFQPDNMTSDFSQSETGDSDWTETEQSGVNAPEKNKGHYPCPECHKTFKYKKCMKKHMRCHTGEKLYSCSVCEKRFSLSRSYIEHMRRHRGERPYSCSVCGKTFPTDRNLHSHMRCHSNNKPYSCPVCKVSFKWKEALVLHIKTHTGEKPYICSDCGKAFRCRGELNRHMKIHTGMKPHTCSICDAGFFRPSVLAKHMKTHTGEKSFSCRVCKRKFSRSFHIKTHKCAVESSDKLSERCSRNELTISLNSSLPSLEICNS